MCACRASVCFLFGFCTHFLITLGHSHLKSRKGCYLSVQDIQSCHTSCEFPTVSISTKICLRFEAYQNASEYILEPNEIHQPSVWIWINLFSWYDRKRLLKIFFWADISSHSFCCSHYTFFFVATFLYPFLTKGQNSILNMNNLRIFLQF